MLAAKVPRAILKEVDRLAGDNRSAWVREAIEEKLHRETPCATDFKPKTAFGRRLLALRQRHLSKGGPTLTLEEIRQEVARRRGERSL